MIMKDGSSDISLRRMGVLARREQVEKLRKKEKLTRCTRSIAI
jgi:hypothetical protein